MPPNRLPRFAEFGARVLPVVSDPDLSAASAHGLLVRNIDLTRIDLEMFAEQCRERKFPNFYIQGTSNSKIDALVHTALKCHAIPVLSSTDLTTSEGDLNKTSLPRLLWSYLRSDRPDGLVPTVVCNEAGVALGLAYSSEESLAETLRTQTGVYQSRKRGLWRKGSTSGDTQEMIRISVDCDNDTLKFTVKQKGRFCHLAQFGCFGDFKGLANLECTLQSRKASAPEGSYTARLFSDESLLRAKIMEEAEELCNAKSQEEIAFEAADLIYFALTRAVGAGVSLAHIEANLDAKSLKVKRRKGDAKGVWAAKAGVNPENPAVLPPAPPRDHPNAQIKMRTIDAATLQMAEVMEALQRPSQKSSETIMNIVVPILADVRSRGDIALLGYTHKFEKATSLKTPVMKAPFPQDLMTLPAETISAIDISFENIRKFHSAQADATKPLQVETMPGVMCSRFSRPIDRVGLYVPGGTAVLPSTALMLGVPAMVAGCNTIVIASPPRQDGSITPEIVYIAHKIGADSIVLAGGAQAVAALAYGTESVPKVDKILGPGNQYVTAAKMYVSNDPSAGVAIDMPAGPSEVLVIADSSANPAFVASDLLSQAEHGVDSQVVLIAIDLTDAQLQAIEKELHEQAMALPRVDIVRGSIKHSVIVKVRDLNTALRISNEYAPEHLILQITKPETAVSEVLNAGSVFIGEWTPESVGDYSAGVNHSLREFSS